MPPAPARLARAGEVALHPPGFRQPLREATEVAGPIGHLHAAPTPWGQTSRSRVRGVEQAELDGTLANGEGHAESRPHDRGRVTRPVFARGVPLAALAAFRDNAEEHLVNGKTELQMYEKLKRKGF